MIEGLFLTPLRVIPNCKGDVYQAMKVSSPGYCGFGEVYFSAIIKNEVKGWKRHNRLTLNLIVPVGEIVFVLYDDRNNSLSCGTFLTITLGIDKNYQKLTVPPGVWVAFHGLSEKNMLMNILAEEHDPKEVDSISLDEIPYSFLNPT